MRHCFNFSFLAGKCRKGICSLTVLLFSGTLTAADFGPVLFSDDFETPGLFAENWDASKGLKPENGQVKMIGNGGLTLRRTMEDKDFAVSVDLKPAKNGADYGHTGIIIDGINFMLRADGRAGTAYRPPSAKSSLGTVATIPDYRFGDLCNVTVIRRRAGESRQYVFMVNGKSLISFQDSAMVPNGKISIYAYRAVLAVDNVTVYSVAKGNDSPNLAVNSSFEYLIDGMPPFINLATARGLSWKAPYEEFLRTIVVDTKEKHSGNQSLRLTFNDSVTRVGFMMFSMGCSVGKPVTGSLWLKADRPELDAELIFWEVHSKSGMKKIKVTDEWKRYEFTLEKPARNLVQFGVAFSGAGTLWADDVQVETGDKATPYRPNGMDEEKFGAKASRQAEIMPDVKVFKTVKAPVIDGDLSDFPKESKVDAFLFKNKPTEEKTVAWIACDERNLYLAFRCFAPDLSKVKTDKAARDTMQIYSPECIEMLFDPTGSRKNYYQLAVNAGNNQADCGLGRNAGWNGQWESAVRLNPKDSSVDYEIAIPLSNFADAGMTDVWGFNLGRHCLASTQPVSLLHTSQINFHLPALFPKLVFPAGTLDSARIGLSEAGLFENPDGKTTFSVLLSNLTGQEISGGKIRLSDPVSGIVLGSRSGTFKTGDTAVRFTSELPASTRNRMVSAELLGKDEKVLARKDFFLTAAGPIQLYNRYSFYRDEKEAEFLGTCGLPPGKYKGVATVDGKKFDFAVTPELDIRIPLKDVKRGSSKVTFEIFDGSKKCAAAESTLDKLPEQKTPYCQIDRKHRTLKVNGKPALIVAPFFGVERWLKPEHAPLVIKTFADAGFKYLTLGSHEADNPATQAFIKEAAKQGISVVYWNFYTWRKRNEWKPEGLLANVDYPNVIALLVADEPELYARGEEVKPFMENYKKAYPQLPVFMNNTVVGIPARFADLTTDIVMIDDYLTNREGREVTEMVDDAEMVEKAGRSERKPAWFFPSGDNLHNHYRECSYDEQVAQCYGMLLKGCSGLVHFCALPKYPRNWDAMKDVNREFLSLQDVVYSEEKCPETVPSEKSLLVMTRRLGNGIYVIALNPGRNPVESEFRLPPGFMYADKAQVRFENRAIPVKNGVFRDSFRGLERHVYLIETRKGPDGKK